jgi:hypothetical protein
VIAVRIVRVAAVESPDGLGDVTGSAARPPAENGASAPQRRPSESGGTRPVGRA